MGGIAGMLVSPVASLLFRKKAKQPDLPPVQPILRQNPGSAISEVLAARRGTQDNRRTGRGGAEASGGVKSKLGQ